MKQIHSSTPPDAWSVRRAPGHPSLRLLAAAVGLLIGVLSTAVAGELTPLQALIDAAPAGGTVEVPSGNWDQPIAIAKAIHLRGESVDACVISVRSDQPAVTIRSRDPVMIEGLTIRWERATTEDAREPQAAIMLRDATATIRQCRVEAPAGNTRCPAGIHATGFTDLKIEASDVRGFECAIDFWGGAKGAVTDCTIVKSGHCGITVGNDSEAEVANNVIVDSEFAGLDARDTCRLHATGNVIVANARGMVVFKESGTNCNQLDGNLLWENKTETEGVDPAPALIRTEPVFKDRAAGDFTLINTDQAVAGFGLKDAKSITALWAGWQAIEAAAR